MQKKKTKRKTQARKSLLLPVASKPLDAVFVARLRKAWAETVTLDARTEKAIRNTLHGQSPERLKRIRDAKITHVSTIATGMLPKPKKKAAKKAAKKKTVKKAAKKAPAKRKSVAKKVPAKRKRVAKKVPAKKRSTKKVPAKKRTTRGIASADLDLAKGLFAGKLLSLHLYNPKTCRVSVRKGKSGQNAIAAFPSKRVIVLGKASRNQGSMQLPDRLPRSADPLQVLSIEYEFQGERYTHPFVKRPTFSAGSSVSAIENCSYDAQKGFVG